MQSKKLTVAMILLVILISSTAISLPAKRANAEGDEIIPPLMKVEPPLVEAHILNEKIKVNVTINNILEDFRVVAVQFRLTYNESLLRVVDVVEGPFMKDPSWNLHGTYFVWYDRPNHPYFGSHVIVGILLYPNATGVWEAFPSGSGVLATITFQAIHIPVEPLPDATCPLNLTDTLILNDEVEEIPHELEHGLYKACSSPTPIIRDVAILSVSPSNVRVTPGTTISINVFVKNEGTAYETFDVSLYYDTHLIGTQTITYMAPGSTEHIAFSWSTSGVPHGTYTLKAEANVVPGETDTTDNVFVDGMVRIGPEALIKVEPPLYQVQLLNKTFKVNVTINDLWEGWRAVAVQFRLCYNETLLEVVDVTEGPFMKDPRWNLHGTYLIWFDQPNDPFYGSHVIVGILLLPDKDTGVWEVFPSGSGVLATITFKTKYQERGLEKPPLTCELTLVDTMVIDDELEEIPLTLEHGLYEMYPTHIGDINYDGKVDMKDVAMVSKAFGSHPGYGPWNPICDVNGDKKVDIKDVAIVSKGFGWSKTYDP